MSLLRVAMLCTSRCEGSTSLRYAFITAAKRQRAAAAANPIIESHFHSSAMPLQPFATPRHRRLAASSSPAKARTSKSASANMRNQSSPALAVADESDDESEMAPIATVAKTLRTTSSSSSAKTKASKPTKASLRNQSSKALGMADDQRDDESAQATAVITELQPTLSSPTKRRASKATKASLKDQSQSHPVLAVTDDKSGDEIDEAPLVAAAAAAFPISSPTVSTITTEILQPSEMLCSVPELLHPEQMLNGTIPYPKSLSPSAILEFKNCPQSFLFQYLWDLKQPTTLVLAKGSMCHEALDKIFDLEPQDRTLEHLHNLFRTSWAERRKDDKYRHLFERVRAGAEVNDANGDVVKEEDVVEWDVTAEQEWGRSGLQLLQNYYNLEDPRQVLRPNPIKREIWVRADLTVDPALGVTGPSHPYMDGDGAVNGTETPTFHVRGIVDRLDMVKVSKSQVALRIVDYKTGKAPNLKYSKAMNEHIRNEVFYQLKIYALLLREKNSHLHNNGVLTNNLNGTVDGSDDGIDPIPSSVTSSTSGGALDLRMLRLFYLTSESGRAQHVDFDLGPTQEARDAVLQEIHADLSKIWTDIMDLVSTQDPKAFVGCKRSFCYCHQCRPRFVAGTLWEPNLAP